MTQLPEIHSPFGRRLRVASAVALILLGLAGLPAATERKTETKRQPKTGAEAAKKGDVAMKAKLGFGFRHDPMLFVEKDRTLQGAMVRTLVFEKPKRGDKQILEKQIDGILAKQRADGLLSDDPRHRVQFTAGRLAELTRLGCPAGRAGVRRAVAALERQPSDDPKEKTLGIYGVRAFCVLGLTDSPLVRPGLEHCLGREKEWNRPDAECPWTPIEHLITLWHGRGLANVTPVVERAMRWIRDDLNGAGCLGYKDPWGVVRLASVIDHPLAREILLKQLPMILRGQRADGGWGDRSLFVFRALKRHGLLDKLRAKPPLPPDWQIVRSVPVPVKDCSTVAWDGERLWTYARKTNEAIAISPADGRVVRRFKLPAKGLHGLGCWNGSLVATQYKPKRLLQIDATTGKLQRTFPLKGKVEWVNCVEKVGDKLWVSDGFMMCAVMIDPATGKKVGGVVLAGPLAADYAPDPEGVWHVDGWAPAVIKSDFTGGLIEWGEKPFAGRCNGLTWDGRQLWALDADNKRMCVIEKTPSGRKLRAVKQTKGAPAMARVAAKPTGTVKRKGKRVCIEAVPSPKGMNSVLASLTAALQAVGEDVTYEYMMGVSSRAFRLQFNWCPSAPHSFCGFNTFEPALRAMGYQAKMYPLAMWEGKTRKQRKPTAKELAVARKAVRDSIDAGMPALMDSEECGVLAGYEPVGKGNPTGWLRLPGPLGPPPKDAPYVHAVKHLPWQVRVISRSDAGPVERRQSVVWSLKTAVRNAHTPDHKGYTMGFAAWERWIRELGNLRPVIAKTQEHLAKFDTDESAPFGIQIGNAWCYDSLIDARRCAAKYLRHVAPMFDKAAAKHLLGAADAYDKLVTTLTEGVKW